MKSLNDQEKDNWKKNITLFLGSQTISLFGSSLVQYAIMWYITLNTQSGVMYRRYPSFVVSCPPSYSPQSRGYGQTAIIGRY